MHMFKMLIGVAILIVTVLAFILLLLWLLGANFDNWIQEGATWAALVFLLGAGITLSGLLIERGLREGRN